MKGRFVSHYRITGTLGVGGMGVVYEAQDTRAPRLVALKFLGDALASDLEAVRRFRREAEILARLDHPRICAVLEVGEDDGRLFIAMERVDGVNLKQWTGARPQSEEATLRIATQVAEALQAAHAAGVVHRDIKPGNIVIDAAGRLKVLDFGLARQFVTDEDGEAIGYGSTLTGRPQGTPGYMAPERIMQLPFDPRSDLFSLGVVMYELASGSRPFHGDSPGDVIAAIFEHEPARLGRLVPGVSAGLDRLVHALLQKQPDDRVASATEVLARLAEISRTSRRWRR